jgi:hypothetical protein
MRPIPRRFSAAALPIRAVNASNLHNRAEAARRLLVGGVKACDPVAVVPRQTAFALEEAGGQGDLFGRCGHVVTIVNRPDGIQAGAAWLQ